MLQSAVILSSYPLNSNNSDSSWSLWRAYLLSVMSKHILHKQTTVRRPYHGLPRNSNLFVKSVTSCTEKPSHQILLLLGTFFLQRSKQSSKNPQLTTVSKLCIQDWPRQKGMADVLYTSLILETVLVLHFPLFGYSVFSSIPRSSTTIYIVSTQHQCMLQALQCALSNICTSAVRSSQLQTFPIDQQKVTYPNFKYLNSKATPTSVTESWLQLLKQYMAAADTG